MKVLIVGSYGLIMGNLLARLHREKCDMYVLTGSRKSATPPGLPRHISFSFPENSADVKYVMQGIMPDYVIFTGVWDENFLWDRDECESEFSSALVNILSWSREYQVPRFCFLSCADAQEEKGTRGKLARNGEKICETYAEEGFQVVTLRLPYVYGRPLSDEDTLDLLTMQCFYARKGANFSVPAEEFVPVYVTDLADAIYRVGREEGQKEFFYCYTVPGKEVVTAEEFESIIKELYPKSAAVPEGQFLPSDSKVEAVGDFCKDFGYFPKIGIRMGLERIEGFLSKSHRKIEEIQKQKQDEERKEKKRVARERLRVALTKVRHILENIILFFAALAAQYYIRGQIKVFEPVDFFLIYLVIIATQRGVGQSILSVILSMAGTVYLQLLEGSTVNEVMAQYDFVMQFMFYFVIGVSIAYSFLNNRNHLKERMEQIQELEDEYMQIIDINKTNVEIKKAFEDRLINYGDSIGKIYNVVSELDVLEVDKVIMAALQVVSKIMGVKDVSIYYAGTDNYFHFVGSTFRENGGKKAILLSDYEEMEKTLQNGDVYINHDIGGDLPRMTAPIFSGKKLIYMIMLWNMEFEELNLYKKDLFLVLVKIISSSLERGYQYEKAERGREYYENTNIMFPDAFRRRATERLQGIAKEELEYSLIEVETESRSIAQLNAELSPLVRDSDRIGYLQEGDTHLYILAHANWENAGFVTRKLMREGFTSKVVMFDEL